MTELAPDLPVPPRNARLRGWHRSTRYTLVALLLALPPGLYLSLHGDSKVLQRLAEHGLTTAGRIEQKTSRRGGKSSRHYYIEYSFVVGGVRLDGEDRVAKGHWDALSPGQTTEVTYLPDDPTTNRLGRATADRAASAEHKAWLAAGIAFAGCAVGVFVLERLLRRNLALLRDGRALRGRVTSHQRKRKYDRLGYVFSSPGNAAEFERSERLPRRLPATPDIGQELVVLQSVDDPTQVASWWKVQSYAVLEE